MVVGQLGQSLDGYIATATGHSKYINGSGGLAHLHRLRACVDAVLVGVGTVVADDPMLTVRLCSGQSPARVVLDPHGRVPTQSKVFNQDGVRCIVLTSDKGKFSTLKGVEVLRLSANQDTGKADINPVDVLNLLASQGLKRVLVEGGAHTIGRFIEAGCIDHLHLIVAPLILGEGKPGLNLKAIKNMHEAKRFTAKTYDMSPDLLIDCDLRSLNLQR